MNGWGSKEVSNCCEERKGVGCKKVAKAYLNVTLPKSNYGSAAKKEEKL